MLAMYDIISDALTHLQNDLFAMFSDPLCFTLSARAFLYHELEQPLSGSASSDTSSDREDKMLGDVLAEMKVLRSLLV